ncbi:MAG TPA: dihydrofolate reductase family protein [Thermomicrobiales bacterium]|nr:dihydrofolate reductase family protein [Thermomicrobiales bacterium]
MRKVVVSMFMTVDGVMEAPNEWSFQFWSDESARYKFDELFEGDALLLGRVTYEGFAAAWPTMTDEQGFADRMNGLPKYVATTTLDDLTWNATRIEGDIAESVATLKAQEGQNILVFGSADLVNYLTDHDLVDEYRLMIFPVVVGKGKHLFAEGLGKKAFRLAASKVFASGVVVQTYAPAAVDGADDAV